MIDCPSCGTSLDLHKPSAPLTRHGKQFAGAWCPTCERAWRALLPQAGEGWRFVWDIGVGDRAYVLNGHVAGE